MPSSGEIFNLIIDLPISRSGKPLTLGSCCRAECSGSRRLNFGNAKKQVKLGKAEFIQIETK